jgi:hypothetical protein
MQIHPGYYLGDQPALSSEFKQMLKSSVYEVDQHQIDIYQKLSPADRFSQGCSIWRRDRGVGVGRTACDTGSGFSGQDIDQVH